jgi:hypothetical protein
LVISQELTMKEPRTFRRITLLAVLSGLLALGGCEQIFTYTPFAALRRDPSTLSSAQQLTYAEQALASGDKTAMAAAYDAIKANPSPDAQHTTAEIGIELSGVSELLSGMVDGTVAMQATSIPDFLAQHSDLKPDYLIDAADRLKTLNTDGVAISTNDRVMGCIGLALQVTQSTTPPYDLTKITAPALAPALAMLGTVPADNAFVAQLNTYLAGLPTP